jgi:hypothetical protein
VFYGIGARVVAIDTEVASINRHLGREGNGRGEEGNRRDLELEREVFGNKPIRPTSPAGERAASTTARNSEKVKTAKKSGKPAAKRRR